MEMEIIFLLSAGPKHKCIPRLSLTITCERRMNVFPDGPRSGRKRSGAQAWLLAPSSSATSALNTRPYLSLSFHSNINTPCLRAVLSIFLLAVPLFACIMPLHTLIPLSQGLQDLAASEALEGRSRVQARGKTVLYQYTLPTELEKKIRSEVFR